MNSVYEVTFVHCVISIVDDPSSHCVVLVFGLVLVCAMVFTTTGGSNRLVACTVGVLCRLLHSRFVWFVVYQCNGVYDSNCIELRL